VQDHHLGERVLTVVQRFYEYKAQEGWTQFLHNPDLFSEPRSSVHPGLTDTWLDRLLECLDVKLRAVRVHGGLQALASRGGSEALSRIAIDDVVLPLCTTLGLWAEPEDPIPGIGRCDYVFRREQQVVCVLEAKKCEPCVGEIFREGIEKCCTEYMPYFWSSHKAADGGQRSLPLHGIVSDGFRYVVVDMQHAGIAISPIITIRSNSDLKGLLRFLAARLQS